VFVGGESGRSGVLNGGYWEKGIVVSQELEAGKYYAVLPLEKRGDLPPSNTIKIIKKIPKRGPDRFCLVCMMKWKGGRWYLSIFPRM